MKRFRAAPLAIFATLALAWSVPASAFGNCANGMAIYNKKISGQDISCSQSSCHGHQVDKNKISMGQNNPDLINMFLDTQPEMLSQRSFLGLTASDIDDIATWIFYGAGNGLASSCPSASPNLQAAPAPVALPSTTVGATSATTLVTITNAGTASALAVTAASSDATHFPLSSNTCTNVTVAAGGTCSFRVAFHPTAAGALSNNVTVNRTGGTLNVGVSGTGASGASPGQLAVPGSISFGSQTVGATGSASNATISNAGGTAVAVSSVTSNNAAEFAVVSNTCATVNPGASCTVGVTFKPSAAGARSATITVVSNGTGSPQSIGASGTGTSASSPGVLSMAGSINFGNQTVGATSAATSVTVTNTGGTAVSVSSVSSSNPTEFAIASSTCGVVNAGASCAFGVTFNPSVAGTRAGSITIVSNGTGSPQAVGVTGTGAAVTTPTTVTVVEYYHAGFDHYFITSVASDITQLDGGAFGGVWSRTGYQFKAYAAPGTGTASVCRFFSTAFAPKSSHFYTPYAFECNGLKSDPGWQYEDSNLIMAMPDGNGNCAAGFTPVYRFYNNFQGSAPNHRYTTAPAIKSQMLAKNYTQEGPLPGLAFMCAPP